MKLLTTQTLRGSIMIKLWNTVVVKDPIFTSGEQMIEALASDARQIQPWATDLLLQDQFPVITEPFSFDLVMLRPADFNKYSLTRRELQARNEAAGLLLCPPALAGYILRDIKLREDDPHKISLAMEQIHSSNGTPSGFEFNKRYGETILDGFYNLPDDAFFEEEGLLFWRRSS